jgi:predicted nucleic acid-binding protein
MLLDTSGLLALLDELEPPHQRAYELYDAATVRLTHSYVLAELVPLANSRGFPRPSVLAYLQAVADDPSVEVVWVDATLHREAIALLVARRDKTDSLCDAVSFVLMRRYGIPDALTTDKHFEQEGFRRLLV